MTKRLTITLVALVLFVMLAVLPVSAAPMNLTNVSAGATVFVGESGLNLATLIAGAPGGTTGIAFYPTNALAGAAYEKYIPITTPFDINAVDFGTREGNWYFSGVGTGYPGLGVALIAADPKIQLKVWDLDQNKDVSGGSVPSGERLTFRIVNNGYVITTAAQRLAVTNPAYVAPTWEGTANSLYGINPVTGLSSSKTLDGFVDIKVKTDQGNTLNALRNASITDVGSVAIPLTGMWVDKGTWDWGNYSATVPYNMYWNTSATDVIGQKVYPAGTYTVTAEYNLNGMKDNYKDSSGAYFAGKTISTAVTITLVSDTVKITANKDTVTRSKPFSVTITGKPDRWYWIWVKGTGQMTGAYDDQPPFIPASQAGVSTTIAYSNFTPQNKVYNITFDVATGPAGYSYWANVRLADTGTRTVEFMTSNQTKAQTYTIRVENNTNTLWEATKTLNADYKTDEVNVKVEKGVVTITASGDGNYYLGEEVKFSGTNTETAKAYLFITGPNLPATGTSIKSTNPRDTARAVVNNVDTEFQVVDVNSDNSWSWKWGTATVALDAGTYTVYAVSAPRRSDSLQDVAYGTVSIIIKKPFVSATISQSTVAKGDKAFVRGIAEGKPTSGVAMWLLGKNFARRSGASVNADGTFEFEITTATTTQMAAGQYFVVVQHPMQNGEFDITACTAATAAGAQGLPTDWICNLQQASAGNKAIFRYLGAGSLQGSDAAEALVQGINSPNVDDTYTKLTFLIEEPIIRIDAVGDRHVGDKFTITAQTNLAVDDEVLFEVYSSSFKPTQKSQSNEFSGYSGAVKVTKGDSGMNKLSFDVDAATFKPDEYIVKATSILLSTTTGTALFNVLEGAAPVVTTAPPVVTTAPPVVTTAPPVVTTVAPAKTPTQPGFGALVALIGLGAVAFLVVRKH